MGEYEAGKDIGEMRLTLKLLSSDIQKLAKKIAALEQKVNKK